MESKNMKMIAAIVMMMMVCLFVGSPTVDAAVTCDTVTSSVAPCIGYLSSGGAPPPACCNGIRSLNSQASTPADRQVACNCLKSAANTIPGIDFGLAAGLPSKCGVSIPYKISPNTDCSSVN